LATRSSWIGALALWCGTALAGGPNYDAFSEKDGFIATEAQQRAAWAMLHDPEQVEALYTDAAKGSERAAHVIEQLEATLAASGRKLAEQASEPECLTPVARELNKRCHPVWAFLDFLSQEKPGAVKLRSAIFRAFAVRAHERGLENQLILSLVNGLLSVALASSVLATIEAGGVGTVANVRRLRPAELETGKRLSRKLGVPLKESPHEAEELIDQAGKTYDAYGVPAAARYWNEKKFMEGIQNHLLKSVDFIVIDLTGFSPAQIAAVERYLSTLPPGQLAKIIRIGF
jgi:hypothetical protein